MTWAILEGDCVEVMRTMPDASVDSICTDPPYGIGFMGHEWDQPGEYGPVDHPPGAKRRQQHSATSGAGHDRARRPPRHGVKCGGPTGADNTTHTARGDAMHAGRYDLSQTANQRFAEWCEAWGVEALRVLKPGGHALVFGGTRTFHRMTVGLEDAGFEIRDCLCWLYGSGFPKSLNLGCRCGEPPTEHDVRPVLAADLSAAIDAEDQRREVLLAGVPQPSASADRQAAQGSPVADRIGEPSVEGWRDLQAAEGQPRGSALRAGASVGAADGAHGRLRDGAPARDGDADGASADKDGVRASSGPSTDAQSAGEPLTVADDSGSQARGGWPLCGRCGKPTDGLGTALKPAWEPVIVARKPLDGTVAANVLAHDTGALNIDGCRIEFSGDDDERESKDKNRHADFGSGPRDNQVFGGDLRDRAASGNYDASGRWPANVVLDPDAAAILDEQTGESTSRIGAPRGSAAPGAGWGMTATGAEYDDEGGASRFFYCAKTSTAERNAGLDDFAEGQVHDRGNTDGRSFDIPGREDAPLRRNAHPTVKPIDLMRWLVRLVTPPGGTVLDPFTGSGTTGCACALEGFDFVGVEREAEYANIARARIAWWAAQTPGLPTDALLTAAAKRPGTEQASIFDGRDAA